MKRCSLWSALLLAALCLVTAQVARAQAAPDPAKVKVLDAQPLWPQGAPGALGAAEQDIPTITPYLPATATAPVAAMVICPGGSYRMLAGHEGRDYALFLAERGIAGFVLKYRLGPAYHHPIMLQDAARAVRMVRANAVAWGIDPAHVGIMGSSAGGHLASTLVTHFDAGDPAAADPIDRHSSRPDLGILCYAVITMGEYTHKGSQQNLLGQNPSQELIDALSNEKHVTKDTPPCFIWHNFEDKGVKIENSINFAMALQRQNVPFELHLYQKGGHGSGLGAKYPYTNPLPWTMELMRWLKVQQFVP